jgi:hypothetical protein
MPRYTITSAALAATTFTGVVAIAQSMVPNNDELNAIGSTPKRFVSEVRRSVSEFNIGPLSPMQRAVLLEGIDWAAPLTAARPGAGN